MTLYSEQYDVVSKRENAISFSVFTFSSSTAAQIYETRNSCLASTARCVSTFYFNWMLYEFTIVLKYLRIDFNSIKMEMYENVAEFVYYFS